MSYQTDKTAVTALMSRYTTMWSGLYRTAFDNLPLEPPPAPDEIWVEFNIKSGVTGGKRICIDGSTPVERHLMVVKLTVHVPAETSISMLLDFKTLFSKIFENGWLVPHLYVFPLKDEDFNVATGTKAFFVPVQYDSAPSEPLDLRTLSSSLVARMIATNSPLLP